MSGTFDEWMSTQRHPEDYTKEEFARLAWKDSFEKTLINLLMKTMLRTMFNFV